MQVGDRYFVEGNIDNMLKFERIKLALTELGIEYATAVLCGK